MEKKKKWKFIIFISLFLVLACIGIYVYEYPYQKYMAKKEIPWYIKQQGIDKSKIKEIEYDKDTKQGGYVATVIYSDDPKLTYEYKYGRLSGYKENHYVNLSVFDGGEDILKGMKYPPIKTDRE